MTKAATILLVEDEPAVRRLFVQALSREGYRVVQASDGREALELFEQHREAIDLLLTDMRMPRMGGAELARQLRALHPSVKLLCVSGYPGSDAADLNVAFLAKPFSSAALIAKVREVLDSI